MMTEKRKERRGAKPGEFGNRGHQRNPQAAAQIEILAGFGLPQWQIAILLTETFTDQGYSEDTLQKHYKPELDRGAIKAKSVLMQGAYDRALGRNVPTGVSPDVAYRVAETCARWLLESVHDMAPASKHKHMGADGGAIRYAQLSDEELEREIAERLARASGTSQ